MRLFRAGDLSERVLGWLFLLPAVLLLTLVALFPVGHLVWTSLTNLNLSSGPEARFVGLENYRRLLADPHFWQSLLFTLKLAAVTVPGAALLGLLLALLVNLPYTVRWPVRLSLLLPWAMPLVFSGLIFRWFFDSEYGVVNDLIRRLGGMPLYWLIDTNLAFWAIALSIVWKTASFMALILFAGLQVIPKEYYEAAQVDGANSYQAFFWITLPLLLPSLLVALIFRTLTALQTFDIPFAMTGGGPGRATETLAMYIRTQSVENLNFGYGSALAVVLFLLCLGFTLAYLRYLEGRRVE